MSNNIEIKSGDSININASTTAAVNVTSASSNVTSVVVSGVQATSGSSDKNYVHTQASPSATWTVDHNLSKRASVSVVDSAGTVIICDVSYTSDNQVVLTFDASTSGQAYLN